MIYYGKHLLVSAAFLNTKVVHARRAAARHVVSHIIRCCVQELPTTLNKCQIQHLPWNRMLAQGNRLGMGWFSPNYSSFPVDNILHKALWTSKCCSSSMFETRRCHWRSMVNFVKWWEWDSIRICCIHQMAATGWNLLVPFNHGQISHRSAAQGDDPQDGIKWSRSLKTRQTGHWVRNAFQIWTSPSSCGLRNCVEYVAQDQHTVPRLWGI